MKTTIFVTLLLSILISVPFVGIAKAEMESAETAKTGPLGFGARELTREMQTDRPDFTEGTRTVDAGHLQLEAGYTYVRDSTDGVDTDTHTLPEFLLRLGITERTELRFFGEGYVHQQVKTDEAPKQTTEGGTDVSIGFKHFIAEQDGVIPEQGIIAELGLPIGSDEFSNNKVQPLVKLLWAYELSAHLGIGGNVNFDFPVVDEQRILELSSSFSAAYSLTDNFGTYIEYFGFYPEDNDVDAENAHYLNGGLSYLFSPNLQLDIRAGFGLNEDADDFFTGAGVSFRQ